MGFSAASLRTLLEAETPPGVEGFIVALSGGADSSCLLTALVQPGLGRFRNLPVRALHVDHGLQAGALDFRRFCERLCRDLGVPLEVLAVAVGTENGVSIEAAARDARYRALASRMTPGQCLLTAHHAQDQAETLLLQLLRGTGLKGLCAMPRCRPWQGGWHLRPLLGVTRHELQAFAADCEVPAVLDPMNLDRRFDRSYLRLDVWPRLEARWPGAAHALSRTAAHCALAQSVLDTSAERVLQRLRDGNALSVRGLRALSATERPHALRHWLALHGVLPPSSARLHEALRQLLEADADQLPAVRWGERALRRYRDRVFLTAAEAPQLRETREWRRSVDPGVELGESLGRLEWAPRRGGLDPERLPPLLRVSPRRGGECLRPERRGRTQTLQHLCQSWGVLPWMRGALPLVYAGNELIAVGDLWTDARWCVDPGEVGIGLTWLAAPAVM
jgi:tRNA(Ile)-lysidine synthase